MMDREQIEIDIRRLGKLRDYAGPSQRESVDRAIARLRADLAKLGGPAPAGFKRIYLVCDSAGALMCWDDIGRARRHAATFHSSVSIVTADVPLPRVVEVEGTVVE